MDIVTDYYKLTESGSAKFFVMKNGETSVEDEGKLSKREIRIIREFIFPKFDIFRIYN